MAEKVEKEAELRIIKRERDELANAKLELLIENKMLKSQNGESKTADDIFSPQTSL